MWYSDIFLDKYGLIEEKNEKLDKPTVDDLMKHLLLNIFSRSGVQKIVLHELLRKYTMQNR